MTIKKKIVSERNDIWLLSRLDFIWNRYFPDILQKNKVYIKFGRFAKYRLGSIRLDRKTKETFVTITSMFKEDSIPQEVVDHTIGHELVHYAHGFSSVSPKLHRYPHAGGVVRKEMEIRGMGYLYVAYKDWIKEYRLTLRNTIHKNLLITGP